LQIRERYNTQEGDVARKKVAKCKFKINLQNTIGDCRKRKPKSKQEQNAFE
jgi:hypothetical protein